MGPSGRRRRRPTERPHHRGAGRVGPPAQGEPHPARGAGHPQASDSFLRQGDPVNVYPFIEAERAERRHVKPACELLEVSRTAFYQWARHSPSHHDIDDRALRSRITEIHDRSRGTYGSPRVHAALRRDGVATSTKRVARLMREQGLHGRRKRRFKRTTIADPTAVAAADLIKRAFGPGTTLIDRAWCSDITYVRTWEGWLYLCAILDVGSRRVVGWSIADHMRTELVSDAL